ncbi:MULTISPECIES: tetratricopeptide repeat protein [Dyadobacter]|uniref:Tetratricopeptide repeat protein n=1 Tax=Dyadobacter chenhuakuii TaxID=2909339 RepID=A0A9X1QFX3_9BACT|nr:MULTISPECIES: tetratricopeptide repeat protein [Dyadobacter]MCF2499024.1 tetratricopeptide repeat protein [Dyadobacter chenhuakuii]MCF2517652.1 tetratricopeptide repeat protein [Dyadobacter sp. CY351]
MKVWLGWACCLCFIFISAYGHAQSRSPFADAESSRERIISEYTRPDSLLVVTKEKYNQAIAKNNDLTAAAYLQQIGRILFLSGHYPQSLEYLLKADKIYRAKGEKKLLAENLAMLGELYYRNRQSPTARKQYDEALGHYEELKSGAGRADIFGRIGHLYEKKQDYDSAFYFQNKALEAYQQENMREGVAKIYENLGSIYEDQERYDSAYANFDRAYKINRQQGHEQAQIEVLNNLGDVLRKTGQYRKGLHFSFQAMELARRKDDFYQLSGAYNDIAKGYNFLNKNDSAFYYLALSREYLTKIYSQESNKQLALLQTLYDIEQKDNEIEQLTQARKADLMVSVAIGVVVVLVILIAGLVISRQRLKFRNEQKLHAQHKQFLEARNQLMEVDLQNKKLQEENLTQQLEIRTKELSSYTLHVIRKNQLLEDLQTKLDELGKEDKRDQKKQIRQLAEQIRLGLSDDQHWEEFRTIFEQVHQSFFDRLQQQSDSLTSNDLRVLALMKMNHTSADIATLLGVSQDSLRVMRHRLRKKLNIQQGDNISTFIQSI